MSDYGIFSSYEGHKERRTGKIRGDFSSPYSCTMCGLEKLGLVDENWSERNLPALLLRTLVVGRRPQSESSIEVALDME